MFSRSKNIMVFGRRGLAKFNMIVTFRLNESNMLSIFLSVSHPGTIMAMFVDSHTETQAGQ